MADGYSKIYGNSFAIIDSFWQYGSPMGSCLRVVLGAALTLCWGLYLIEKDSNQKKGE